MIQILWLDMTRVVVLIVALILSWKKGNNVLSTEATVAAGANTMTLQYPEVAPSSHRIDMNTEKLSYLSYCQHRVRLILTYHTLSCHTSVSTPSSAYKMLLNILHSISLSHQPAASTSHYGSSIMSQEITGYKMLRS